MWEFCVGQVLIASPFRRLPDQQRDGVHTFMGDEIGLVDTSLMLDIHDNDSHIDQKDESPSRLVLMRVYAWAVRRYERNVELTRRCSSHV
jgi:hypothetical protein